MKDRLDLGLLTQPEATSEYENRGRQRKALVQFLKSKAWLHEDIPSEGAVLKAWLSHLAQGNTDLVLVNIEDLWLEPLPQNVPGTWEERPNWKRKAAYSWETISQMSSVLDTLRAVHDSRNAQGGNP